MTHNTSVFYLRRVCPDSVAVSVTVHIVEASAQCLSGNISVLENVLLVRLERLSGVFK